MWHPHGRSVQLTAAGHGLGHATRVIEVSRHLLDAGHAVTIVSSAALARHTRHLPQNAFALRDQLLDCGSKQVSCNNLELTTRQHQHICLQQHQHCFSLTSSTM
jgi:UDP:flavonoid glycosyltransferase YjiC (YdhE family)